MWPWQQNVQYNKRYFFKEIVGFVFVAHLVLLAAFFLCDMYQFHQERFVIQPSQSHATIVFMPLQKRVPQKQVQIDGVYKNQAERKVITIDQYEQLLAQNEKQKNVQNPIKTESKKDSIQKPLATKSITKNISAQKENEQKSATSTIVKKVVQPVTVSQKKAATTLQAKKEIKKAPLAKKIETKKVEKKILHEKPKVDEKIKPAVLEKKVEKIAQPVKQLEDKAVEPEKKELEIIKKEEKLQETNNQVVQNQEHNQSKVSSLNDTVKTQIDAQDIVSQVAQQSKVLEQDIIDLSNVTFVGSQDLEMMQVKEQIELQLITLYKPPVGIKKNAVCELLVTIGLSGKSEKIIVKKSSGNIANDLCAKAAASKAIYPKQVCGKEIIIALGQ